MYETYNESVVYEVYCCKVYDTDFILTTPISWWPKHYSDNVYHISPIVYNIITTDTFNWNLSNTLVSFIMSNSFLLLFESEWKTYYKVCLTLFKLKTKMKYKIFNH